MAPNPVFRTYEERDRHVEGTALNYLHAVVLSELTTSHDKMTAAVEILRHLRSCTYGADAELSIEGRPAGKAVQKRTEADANGPHSVVLLHEDVAKAPSGGDSA